MFSKVLVVLLLGILMDHRRAVMSLDNGLSLTPPMGWMTWQRFRCTIDCKTFPRECIRWVYSFLTQSAE